MQGEYILQQGEIGRKEYPLRFPGKSQLLHSIKEEIRKVKREKERASGKYGYQRHEHLTSESFDPPHSTLRARGACEARSWKEKNGTPQRRRKRACRETFGYKGRDFAGKSLIMGYKCLSAREGWDGMWKQVGGCRLGKCRKGKREGLSHQQNYYPIA